MVAHQQSQCIHQSWCPRSTARRWELNWPSLCDTQLYCQWPGGTVCPRHGPLRCSSSRIVRPQHCSAVDRAGDRQAVCTRATSWPASGSSYGILASQWWDPHQWIQYRGLYLLCLPHLVPNWCCQFCGSTTTCSHCRELLQAPAAVQRWPIRPAPSFPLLCSQHGNALAGTSSWTDLRSATSSRCPALCWGAPRHGRSWRGGLLQPSAALCCQSESNEAVLVQAVQSSHCHGGHTRSTSHLLHPQCSRPSVARACITHLPWWSRLQLQPQQGPTRESCHCRLVFPSSHPEIRLCFLRCRSRCHRLLAALWVAAPWQPSCACAWSCLASWCTRRRADPGLPWC